jgi:hypothetical protein
MKEDRYLVEGISTGAVANAAIADVIAAKTGKMLEESLETNFETILQAKLSQVVNEVLALHVDKTQSFAKKFLEQSRSQMAQGVLNTQHNHRLAALRSFAVAEDLHDFDPALAPEVARLGDEAGSILIEVDAESSVGF